MATVIDDTETTPISVARTIVVTPEPVGGEPLLVPPIGVEAHAPTAVASVPTLAVPAVRVAVGLPRPVAPLLAPPIRAAVQAGSPVPVWSGVLAVPPLELGVAGPSEGVISATGAVPPIGMGAAVHVPALSTTSLTLSSPAPEAVVTSDFPQFLVALDIDADAEATYTIEVQYDSTATFTDDPVTLTGTLEVVDGGVALTPAQAVPHTTWWRARLLQGDTVVLDWSTPQRFTVDTAVAATTVPVTWTVADSAVRAIHLWHFVPPGGEVGEPVTAYGQGFPLTPGNVTVGGIVAGIQSWTLVPADTTGADPGIDGDTVTPEHFEVIFTVPDIEEPGGPVVVEA